MTDKFRYRRALSGKWQMAEHAKTVETALAMEAQLHLYFSGATSLDTVANHITEQVLAQQPELLPQTDEISPEALLQIIALAAQSTVLQALEQPQPSQTAMLTLTVAQHFARKRFEPELAEPYVQLQQQILTLHQHWQTMLNQRQRSQRSIG
ncbi:hypothetical protein [uncultured Ferrimonas sp.]|uniref:hypothetical protein n=1 Tax=uncultured Ferrimonas sp. TaxID=432640 RepID=UPI002615BB15|nr:hypothetical protein [uncultured Ferrimonas sp.]